MLYQFINYHTKTQFKELHSKRTAQQKQVDYIIKPVQLSFILVCTTKFITVHY